MVIIEILGNRKLGHKLVGLGLYFVFHDYRDLNFGIVIFFLFGESKYIIPKIRKKSRGILKLDKENLEKGKLAKEIGQRVRALRTAKNFNAKKLYQITGISAGNQSSMETGKTFPSSPALIKLSELYGVTADWILKGKTINKNSEETEKSEYTLTMPDLELAAYFSRIAELWEKGDERVRNWVIIQLENAFEKIAEDVKKNMKK